MEAESDFSQSEKSDLRACHLGSDAHSEPRQGAAAFYLAQTLPSEMHMTPGTTDREFKSSVENSASSHASAALSGIAVNNNFGGNIYIAGASERGSMEADMF